MGSSPKANWAGQVFLGEGWALSLGFAADTAPHTHHAVQIAVALVGPVGLRVAGVDVSVTGAVAVPPDVVHQMGTSTGPLAILYLDPESGPARQLAATWEGKLHHCWPADRLKDLTPLMFKAAKAGTDEHLAKRLMEVTLRVLVPIAGPPPSLDPRVRRALVLMKRDPRSLEALAKAVQLSPSRLGHLFSENVGLPFRSYGLWLRLQAALRILAEGVNLTTAAHHAGFSDSAHFSRSFKRMFGISPIDLIRSSQLIQSQVSDSRGHM